MRVTVACTQMRCSWDIEANVARAEALVHQAADAGAQIILLQELFETPYFCIDEQMKHLDLAHTLEEQPTLKRMQAIAKTREVVLPVSFFERAGLAHYNAVAVVDADGRIARPLPQEPHPRLPGLRGEVLLQPRRHRLPGDRDAPRPHRRGHLLGPVVSGGRARHGPEGRRAAALPDRHRQ